MTVNPMLQGRNGLQSLAEMWGERIESMLPGLLLQASVSFWDGSVCGSADPIVRVSILSPRAFAYLLRRPSELGLARAIVTGSIALDGDLVSAYKLVESAAFRGSPGRLAKLATYACMLGAESLSELVNARRPAIEFRRTRVRDHHLRRRAAVSHHYDAGNTFYEILLGPSMTYTCAVFREPGLSLEDAQIAKHDLIAAKLGLPAGPGSRILDIGCGWGQLAIHAASNYGWRVSGVTLSKEQAEYASERVRHSPVSDSVEIIHDDIFAFRSSTLFDAVTSVGMSEAVGRARIDSYFERIAYLVKPGGRVLNHAITTPGGSRLKSNTAAYRYVFPDGELIELPRLILAAERAGLHVLGVESIGKYYVPTLMKWLENMDRSRLIVDELIGVERARVWSVYLAASARKFDSGVLDVHQVLAVRPDGETIRSFERMGTRRART